MILMAGLESLLANIHYLQDMIDADTFALCSMILGILTSMGGVYFRAITTKPLSER